MQLLKLLRHTFSIMIMTLLASACGGSGKSTESPTPVPEPTPAPIETPAFEQIGLDGLIINQLALNQNTVFAATDKGLYSASLSTLNWVLQGFENKDVVTAIIDENEMYASIRTNTHQGELWHKSGEQSWQLVKSNFGGDGNELINDIKRVGGALYAIGTNVLATSADNGIDWQILDGNWYGFASGLNRLVHHDDKNTLWYGGQGAIENAILSRLDTQTLAMEFYQDLFPAPSSIMNIRFDDNNSERVIVSGEGGIIQSFDYGESWQDMLREEGSYRFYFDIVRDSSAPNRLITAGWDKNFDMPQPFIAIISENDGESWQQFTLENDAIFGGVFSMLVIDNSEYTEVYFGLYKGGVLRGIFPR